MRGNDFDPVSTEDGDFSIEHLKDHKLVLDVEFGNAETRSITVHMRPTNHLFSREVEPEDSKQRSPLEEKGYWLKSYVHYEGNYQQIKDTPPVLKENRIFCQEKWLDSFYFPSFVILLQEQPVNTTVLANRGDDKTCLSGILEIEDKPDKAYLVFFTLTKVNSKEINMLIASAYCVSKQEHEKAKRLISCQREDKKPFIIIIRNILEGRLPLESKKQNNRAHKMKKKKKKSS